LGKLGFYQGVGPRTRRWSPRPHTSPEDPLSRSTARIISLAGLLLTCACNDAGLAGSSGKKSASGASSTEKKEEPTGTKPPKAEPETEPAISSDESTQATESSPSPSPEPIATEQGVVGAALANCMKDWPAHPFSEAELASPEEIVVEESNDNNGTIYSDDESSEKPRLVLITITSKNVNSSVLELLDPKGWYCVDVLSKAANNFTIRADCKAVVATLAHSAHVDNGFKVERTPGC
jgi:hypothetical protein